VIKYFLLALLLINSFIVRAQDLTGFWKGSLNMPQGCFISNNLELQLTVKGREVIGSSYQYFDINNYIKKKLQGTYDPTTKKITLQETQLITYKIPRTCEICIKKFELQFNKEGELEVLIGDWTGQVISSNRICVPDKVSLARVKESAFKDIPEIAVDTGEIRLDFYDNAVIDGDSITILVNKQVILTHQKLTLKPVTSFIKVDLRNTFFEVEMVAENLGSIPPNTALLIITAGKNKYELFLTSSKEKNAVVRFLYDADLSKSQQLHR
jgi:hypothetical protein